jgi:hypothetical protein
LLLYLKSTFIHSLLYLQITALEEETGAKAFFALAKPGQDLPEVYTSGSSTNYWQGQEQVLAGFASHCFPNAGEFQPQPVGYVIEF